MDSSLRLLLLMIGVVFIAVLLWDSFRRTRFDQQRKKQLVDNHRALEGVTMDLNEGIDKNTEDLPPLHDPVMEQATTPAAESIAQATRQSTLRDSDQWMSQQIAENSVGSEIRLSSAEEENFDDLALSTSEADEELTDIPSFQLEPPPTAIEDPRPLGRAPTHGRAEIPFHAALGRDQSRFSRPTGEEQSGSKVAHTAVQVDGPVPHRDTKDTTELTGSRLSASGRQPSTVPPNEEHIVVFHVRAKRGKKLKGEQLHRLFEELGLEFGDMNIYHHFSSNDNPKLRSRNQPVFSVANSHEPGTFPDAGLDAFETNGLSFFMRLPNPIDGDKAFDQLLSTVGRIAHDIDGEICDSGRQLLTKQSANRSREIAKRYKHSEPVRSSYTH